MAQRSPHNARYQKHTKPEGKTRRSAASVKPKRDAGGTPGTPSKSAGGTSAKGSSRAAFVVTPEYRKWRNVWWGMLAASAACAAGYLLVGRNAPPGVGIGLLVVCYAFLGAGMYVERRKVRPARDAAIVGGSTAKPSKKIDRPTDTSAD